MNTNRRQFLATVTAAAAFGTTRAVAANDKVVLGSIGPGGMGTNLLKSFVAQKDVEIAWVCDAAQKQRKSARQIIGISAQSAEV